MLTLQHRLDEANAFYREIVGLVGALRSQDSPRYYAKRIAIRILEIAATDSDLLTSLALSHTKEASQEQDLLHRAFLMANFVSYLALSKTHQIDGVLCALLLEATKDSYGILTSSKSAASQRALLIPLLVEDPDLSHYRQALASFQYQLGFDRTGEPKMDFPVKIHPFAHLLTIADDFLQLLKARPQSLKALLLAMRQRAGLRYHPALIKLFLRLIGPAPVRSILRVNNALFVSVQYQPSASSWMVYCEPLGGGSGMTITAAHPEQITAVLPPPWVDGFEPQPRPSSGVRYHSIG